MPRLYVNKHIVGEYFEITQDYAQLICCHGYAVTSQLQILLPTTCNKQLMAEIILSKNN